MNRYIDAHCHIFSDPTINGVGAICNSVAPDDWGAVSNIADKNKHIYGAVGVHPWHISNLTTDWKEELKQTLIKNPDLMVGESGLDKYYDDMPKQISVFVSQLKIAHEFNRGLCVHCVGAYDKFAHIIKEFRSALPRFILLHCYQGTAQDIKKIAEKYNVYFSYGPRNLQNSARILSTPTDRILAETDSDNPNDIVDVVNRIAGILDIANDKMADIIYQNTIRMLNS